MESPASSSSQQTTPVAASLSLTSSQSTPNLVSSGIDKSHRSSSISGKDEKKHLKLASPFGADPIYFMWNPDPKKGCVTEIVDIIRAVTNFIPEIKEVLEKNEILTKTDFTNYDQVKIMCKKFSKTAHSYFKSIEKPGEKTRTEYANPDLLKLICCKAYNRSVDNEKKLNKHYSAFSSQTYGETSYERLKSIIDEIEPKETDVFIDLGSGVGNLVVQMAGGSRVKRAIGIEVADLPAQFARKMEVEFKLLMRWFGKKYRPFKLHHGDFLDPKFKQTIQQEASILFVNNYAFTAELEDKIKHELLSELKEGTKIISTKPYAVPNRQITHRQLGDIASIVDVMQLKDVKEPCSWTSNTVPYYLHIINRAKLEHYFASLKNQTPGSRSDTPCSKVSSKGSRESSIAPIKNGLTSRNGTVTTSSTPSSSVTNSGNGDLLGPTTRKKWSQYVTELESTKKKDDTECTSKSDTEAAMEVDVGRPPTPLSTEASRARTASIVDTIASVADGTAGSIKQLVSPPAKKKAKKDSPEGKLLQNRGRPRKNGSQTKTKMSREALEGIEMLHNMTREACQNNPMETVFDPSFILTDVQSSMKKNIVKPEVTSINNKYPNLDIFMNELKMLYVKFLDSLQTDEFVQTLQRRDQISDNQISEEGVAVFKESMKQQGIDLEKPKTTVGKARRFLQRYNKVVEIVETLEAEMALMEADSKELIADYSANIKSASKTEPEEVQPVNSNSVAPQAPLQIRLEPHLSSIPPATPSAASVHSVRNVSQQQQSLTSNIGLDQLLINNLAENLTQQQNSNNFLQNNGILQALTNLDTNLLNPTTSTNYSYNNITQELLNLLQQGKSNPTNLSERINGSNFHIFNNGNNNSNNNGSSNNTISNINNISSSSNTSQTIPSSSCTSGINQPSTSTTTISNANSMTSDTNNSVKKPRARTVRAPSNKKNSVSKETEDPVKKEEIDKKIMDIVQIALEVDKSAKSQQEKERKARNSEKRSKDKNTNNSPTNNSITGKKRTSTEAALNQSQNLQSTSTLIPQSTTSSSANIISTTSTINPSFSSPSTSANTSNTMQQNLLYYQRFGINTPLSSAYNPTTPITSIVSTSDIAPDLMNLIANSNPNGSKDIGDAIQSLLRMDNRFANLITGQNGITAQYPFQQQQTVNQLLESVTNGTSGSPTVQVPGSTGNGSSY